MSAPRKMQKMANGTVGVSIKNAGTQRSDGGNKPTSIKNAVGMCHFGTPGYKKIKGTVSG